MINVNHQLQVFMQSLHNRKRTGLLVVLGLLVATSVSTGCINCIVAPSATQEVITPQALHSKELFYLVQEVVEDERNKWFFYRRNKESLYEIDVEDGEMKIGHYDDPGMGYHARLKRKNKGRTLEITVKGIGYMCGDIPIAPTSREFANKIEERLQAHAVSSVAE